MDVTQGISDSEAARADHVGRGGIVVVLCSRGSTLCPLNQVIPGVELIDSNPPLVGLKAASNPVIILLLKDDRRGESREIDCGAGLRGREDVIHSMGCWSTCNLGDA